MPRVPERKGEHDRDFEKNSDLRVDHELFLERAVNPPGGRNPERNPGELPEGRDHEGDSGGRESDRGPLHAPETLREKENAQQHRNEGRQKGSDSELHDLFGDDADHVDPPVEGGEHRGREQ